MRTSIIMAGLAALTLLLTGCGKSAGEPCEVTGDGFTRRDPCVEMCIEWAITCPDGREVTPNACSGAACGETGECPDDQICLQVDSFAINARCVPATFCAAP